jgi:hypothetical protein
MSALKSRKNTAWLTWLSLISGGVIISLLLSWSANHFLNIQEWPAFLAATGIAAALLAGGWQLLKVSEHGSLPKRLGIILLAAVFLRILAGAAWFQLMPAYGHGTPEEQAGYIMSDAYTRDRTAWDLATSEKPLTRAFQGVYR